MHRNSLTDSQTQPADRRPEKRRRSSKYGKKTFSCREAS